MMKGKYISVIVIGLVCLLSLSGCGSSDSETVGGFTPDSVRTEDGYNVDPFNEDVFGVGDKKVNVVFAGYSPYITCNIENTIDSAPYCYIIYTSDSDEYAQGDDVTITASLNDEGIDAGYKLVETETTLSADGFGYCITSLDQITNKAQENINTVLKEELGNALEVEDISYFDENGNESYIKADDIAIPDEFEVYDILSSNADDPEIFILFECNVNSEEYSGEVYGCMIVTNMYIGADESSIITTSETELNNINLYETEEGRDTSFDLSGNAVFE